MAKRLAAKVGEYTKDGATKGEYVRLGVVLTNDNGEYMLLDPTVNLAGVLQKQNMYNHSKGKKTGTSVMVAVFDDSQQHGGSNQQNNGGGHGGGNNFTDFDDDLAF